jgi:hypothetical protein
MTDFFRFIGEDGSMGYRAGKIYLLTISDWYHNGVSTLSIISSLPRVFKKIGIYCPYSSCETFFKNWERV